MKESESPGRETKESHFDDDKLFGTYVDFKAIAKFLWRARWVMLGTLVISMVVCQMYLLLATKKYTARVSIAEKGAQASAGSLSDGGIMAKLFAAKSDSSGALSLTYAVRSTAVAERVVKSQNLQDEWLRKRIDIKDYEAMGSNERFLAAVSIVRSEVTARADRNNPGLIEVSLTDIDPKVAYELLRHFLIQLQYVMSATDMIFNKRVRLFYEDRLKVFDNRLLMFGAEIARLYGMDKFSYDKSTFVHRSSPLENYTEGDFEFGVSSLDFLSRIHENVISEVKGLRSPDELTEKIEVPQQVYLTFLEDKYNMLRSLRASFAMSYEQAMVSEKMNAQRYVVVEAPVLPKKPSAPKVFLTTFLSFIVGLFLAVWSAVVFYFMLSLKAKKCSEDDCLEISRPALASETV